jgi:hypothetical protein
VALRRTRYVIIEAIECRRFVADRLGEWDHGGVSDEARSNAYRAAHPLRGTLSQLRLRELLSEVQA